MLGSRRGYCNHVSKNIKQEGKTKIRFSIVTLINRNYSACRGTHANVLEQRENLIKDDVSYRGVEKIKYLGLVINDSNSKEEVIESRVEEGTSRFAAALHRGLVFKIMR